MESREAEVCSRSQSHTASAALPKLRSGRVQRASLGEGRHAPAWKAPRAPRDTVHLEALGVVHRKEAWPVNGSMVNVARRLAVWHVRCAARRLDGVLRRTVGCGGENRAQSWRWSCSLETRSRIDTRHATAVRSQAPMRRAAGSAHPRSPALQNIARQRTLAPGQARHRGPGPPRLQLRLRETATGTQSLREMAPTAPEAAVASALTRSCAGVRRYTDDCHGAKSWSPARSRARKICRRPPPPSSY